tara:strand:+ start:6391 stop:10704 length:4314 start_codon:yes stop_codon:yes gene_type:complete
MINFSIIDGLDTNSTPIEGILSKEFEILARSTAATTEDAIYEWKLQNPNNSSAIDIPESQNNVLRVKLTDSLIDNKISNEGVYKLLVTISGYTDAGVVKTLDEGSVEIKFKVDLTETDSNELDTSRLVFSPFVSTISDISANQISIKSSWNEIKNTLAPEDEYLKPTNKFSSDNNSNFNITFRNSKRRDLNTFLHFGDDKLLLTTNVKTDKVTFEELPYSAIFKLYEELPDDIEEKDTVFIVREVLPQVEEVVELMPYDQEEEDVIVLRVPDSTNVDSPITNRTTNLQNYDDLVTDDAHLKKEIEDKYLTEKPKDINIDYSNYENFINFSSAEKRLKNFKYKIQQLETYTAESASLLNIPNSNKDVDIIDTKIRDIKNNFDGYETYLYNISSSYVSSSLGEFSDASWPKTGTGTYANPYKPVSSSNHTFTSWYGTLLDRNGQIYSASIYDEDNSNRLVNLLPEHIKEDSENSQFFDFMDMVGQHFDELWAYTKAMSDITDRQNDLSKGFSKDLVYNLAKSLGWDIQDGKDLLDLSRAGFGQKLSGTTYSLYTSGSLSSPPESDISKEITKRLIASMPYLLKTKGTIGALKGVLNCYGIPSSILRVREFGGLQKDNHKAQFEIARKFTKALRFKGEQYVETTWADDDDSSRKPDTVEFRFRAVSGSDQILLQKDTEWAIKLKENDSPDNNGTVSFMLTGSNGLQEISSSILPVFDGEYHSVMLRKTKVESELFESASFEITKFKNPPFVQNVENAENGIMKIVSSSNVARSGTKSLSHENTSFNQSSFFKFYKKSTEVSASVSTTLATQGESFIFSGFAKVSSSAEASVGRLSVFELDKNEEVVNWDREVEYSIVEGGIKSSEEVGLNETDWKQIIVQKTIKFPNTKKLGVRFENLKPQSTIYWDDFSLQKVNANTDAITDIFNYDLFVKKYESGLDRIIHSSKTSLNIDGSSSSSYNASWTGSGNLYIGGHSTGTGSGRFNASRFGGSMMEFRLWTEPLKEQYFNTHVENPKSYIGNSPSSSYYHLVRRFALNDDKTLTDGDSLRDISANQTYVQSGSARGFGAANTFESVIDKTKTIIPNHGPNRRMATKIRIENNVLSGSAQGASLSRNKRFDFSANDFSPVDSPKLGIYFSPVDVVNEDIISSFANLDFNQYLGDPRDNFEESYTGLTDVSNEYFKKYSFGSGSANFWDYMHIIKYYDQSVFKQLKKLVPARAKTYMGTLIEGNIFERPKSPVQRNNPTYERIDYLDNINISNIEHESGSVLKIETDYPTYEANITASYLKFPSLYNLASNDNYNVSYDETFDRNLYISGSAKYGGPNYVFSEPTGAMVLQNRISTYNKEYVYFYTSSGDFSNSMFNTSDKYLHFYSSKSLVETDLDPEYQYITALNNSFYEGVKNTLGTTTDGDYPVVVRTTSPTVAVPVDSTDTNLNIIDTE